jgi:KRAB domain-containing zinc finger protein
VEKLTKEYRCEECNFVTTRVRDMTTHTKEHKTKNGICFYCDKYFEHQEDLLAHQDTHTGDQPFECTKCGIRFKTRTLWAYHKPKHTTEAPYICEVCS